MSVALARLYTTPDTRSYERLREIENNYYLELTAERVADLVDVQEAILQAQSQTAARDVALLASFEDFASLVATTFDDIAEQVSGVRQAIDEQTSVLGGELRRISDWMIAQHQRLVSIEATLREPLETHALELRRQADTWLRAGLAADGKERDENLADAESLLVECTKNPVGNQDYVTWFQLGFLRWKRRADYMDAELAFSRSVRLSSLARDEYHVRALRHLAHMQAIQGRLQDAVQTMERARVVADTPDVLYDSARYSVAGGAASDGIAFLRRAVEGQPTLSISMLVEPDFAPARNLIGQLANELRLGAIERGRNACGAAMGRIEDLRPWEPDWAHVASDAGSLSDLVEQARNLLDGGSYLGALRATAMADEISERSAQMRAALAEACVQDWRNTMAWLEGVRESEHVLGQRSKRWEQARAALVALRTRPNPTTSAARDELTSLAREIATQFQKAGREGSEVVRSEQDTKATIARVFSVVFGAVTGFAGGFLVAMVAGVLLEILGAIVGFGNRLADNIAGLIWLACIIAGIAVGAFKPIRR